MSNIISATSYRLRSEISGLTSQDFSDGLFGISSRPHSQHPPFAHLLLLIFEAVLEVVCVSLPGYIIARQGMFDAESQKFVANLNVMLFTPCLIFSKLASQLTLDKLADLAIIPVLFITQTAISYGCSRLVSKGFGFTKRKANFVTAMGVFGNSNSLPISLVISLSKTIKGLHWDKVPGDNDNEVAARGILYLMIFQQLGQLLRWSWGYHVLLAPASKYEEDANGRQARMENQDVYTDEPNAEDSDRRDSSQDGDDENDEINERTSLLKKSNAASSSASGSQTPRSDGDSTAAVSDADDLDPKTGLYKPRPKRRPTGLNGHMTSFPSMPDEEEEEQIQWYQRPRLYLRKTWQWIANTWTRTKSEISASSSRSFHKLPKGLQRTLCYVGNFIRRFAVGVWEFMNPPLWAMLVALIVATVPELQRLFFTPGTIVQNSVTRAITQGAGVAVPLILVVLGANLARNTLPQDDHATLEDAKDERRMLIASIVSRMLLPFLVMAPLLALISKYLRFSILDDPIFVIVCFLITGAPSALQLAQICQINGVFEGVMSSLLFQSYVIWILPSTVVLVMSALEVVEWAQN